MTAPCNHPAPARHHLILRTLHPPISRGAPPTAHDLIALCNHCKLLSPCIRPRSPRPPPLPATLTLVLPRGKRKNHPPPRITAKPPLQPPLPGLRPPSTAPTPTTACARISTRNVVSSSHPATSRGDHRPALALPPGKPPPTLQRSPLCYPPRNPPLSHPFLLPRR